MGGLSYSPFAGQFVDWRDLCIVNDDASPLDQGTSCFPDTFGLPVERKNALRGRNGRRVERLEGAPESPESLERCKVM